MSRLPATRNSIELERVVEATLGNGLRVRLLPERSLPTVSYCTVFRVGSRNERVGLTGISHLFEHMMFNGAAKYGPRQFDKVLESRGGYSNAYTSNDLTLYYEDFASEALETVVDLESDRMRSLRIDDEALAQEREVVKEERRLRTENSVFGLMEEQLESLVFLAHPYRWPIIGWMEDIERITRADCEAFFRTYYAPSNATIYAVGDLDPAATLELLQRGYGDIPAGPAPAPIEEPAPELFPRLGASGATANRDEIDLVLDIPVQLTVELGRTRIPIKHILQLAQGSVIELDALAGEPMDVLVNGFLIAQGEVVVVNDKFGIRLTDIVTPSERMRRLSR